MRKRSYLLAAGACLATLSLTVGLVGSAIADPRNPAGPRQLSGVGSNTSEAVMNGYGNGADAANPPISSPPFPGIGAPNKIVASYDSQGGPISTKPAATNPECQNLTRPNGSSAGNNALAGLTPGFPANCVEFSRSSDNQAAARAGQNLTFIPFALDGITYATLAASNVPKNLTQAQLRAIYQRNAPCGTLQPLIPQTGSGTRSFWVANFGPLGNCVSDLGNTLEEHDGSRLTNSNQLVPYGVGPWISQTTQPSIVDRHGNTVLRAIDGISPIELDAAHPKTRELYNVVRNGGTTPETFQPGVAGVFVGPGSQVCSHPEVLKPHGLKTIPNCGSTAIRTPPAPN